MNLPNVNRITYIIGNNGSGKSRSLEENAQLKCKERPVFVISSGSADKFTYSSTSKATELGSYTYLGNRTVGNAIHMNTISANVVLLYLKLFNKSRLRTEFEKFLRSIGFEPVIGVAYRKLKRNSEEIPPFSGNQKITKSFIQRHQNIFEGDTKPFQAVFKKDGRTLYFSHLSSGEQSIIATALKIAAHAESNACFYIDEPEISLHVEWQIRWPEVLTNLLPDDLNIQVYVATHSPVIISSAMKTGAACYVISNGTLTEIDEANLNVERIIFNDFNTLTPDNKQLHHEFAEIVTRAVEGLNQRNQKIKGEITQEVQQLKKRVDSLSKASIETEAISGALQDFESAINELFNQNIG